ncbi:MAG: hypothetical protein ACREKS_18340 [Candidatus Rokuibacteriota bacterium]
MSSPVEPPRLLRLAAYGIPLGLLALAAIPIYLALDAEWRSLLVRLVCATAVALGSMRLVRNVRRAAAERPNSPADVPPVAPATTILDDAFLRRRDELTYSVRSRRYFDAVLWPRLLALAGRQLSPPPRRPWCSRLGPSRAMIDTLITEIERRP